MYTLLNESTGKQLEVRSSLWYAETLEEAESMRDDFREIMKSMGLERYAGYVVVIPVKST